MTLALVVLVGGLSIFGIVLVGRYLDYRQWRRSLVTFRLRLPRGVTDEDMATWLSVIAADNSVNRFSALRWPAMVLEVVAAHDAISHYVLVANSHRERLFGSLKAALPGARLEETPGQATPTSTIRAAVELRVTSRRRLLAQERSASASAVFLASLLPLNKGETIQTQWIIAGTPLPALTQPDRDSSDLLPWLLRTGSGNDRELLRSEQLKYREPLLKLSGRIAVTAGYTGRAGSLLARVTRTLHLLNAPGISVTRRLMPSCVVAARFVRRWVPLAEWPVVANAKEAVGLLGLPVGELHLPGLTLGAARQLPPSVAMSRQGVVMGRSNYPGMSAQPLALKVEDRLRHQYILGPTGTGKSTLLANMARQDAEAGHGLVLIDPKADFVYDVLARLPDERLTDVIVLDPANTAHPVGFNPLTAHGDEHARELAAETTVHILHDIFRAYWGPRTDDLMRAAVSSLAQVSAPNGQRFTLCEVAELLTSPALRRYVVSQPQLDQRWKDYWLWYDSLSEGERLHAIGPVLNKLRAFTTRSSLRLVLGQSEGITIADVFTKRKILLVPLAKGQIGVEASALLGSLLVGALWQAAQARSAIPAEKRHAVFAYLDEFQDVVRLSDDLGDMLAQARGLGLGVVLAHQYLKQIPEATRAAVLGTARTQLAFQVEHDDARLLEKRFAPGLAANDLMGLQTYEAAMRPCVDGQTLSPVTLRTLPLPEPRRDAALVARQLAETQGVARAEVETGLKARVHISGSGQLGRRSRREAS